MIINLFLKNFLRKKSSDDELSLQTSNHFYTEWFENRRDPKYYTVGGGRGMW